MNEASSSSTARRSFWRFSLRELLLAMLATAAFLGWGVLSYQRFQRFEPTPFYLEHSDCQEDIAAALKEIGEEGSVNRGWTSTQTWGPSAVQSTKAYSFRLPTAKNGTFIQAFEARISERLMASGCQLRGFAGSDSGNNQALIVGYRADSVVGAADVCFFPSDGSDARVVIILHEQRAWSGDLSVGAGGARSTVGE